MADNGTTIALIKSLGAVNPEVVNKAASDWLEENITNPDSPPLDRSLSSSSAAAPADIVGELKSAISEIRSGGTKNLFNDDTLAEHTGISSGNGAFFGKASDFGTFYLFETAPGSESRYTISFKAKNTGTSTSGNGLGIKIEYTNGTNGTSYLPNSTSEFTQYTITSDSTKTISKIRFIYNSGGNNVWEVKEIQCESGASATSYEPFYTAYDKIARADALSVQTELNSLSNKALQCGEIDISSTTYYQSFNDLPLNKICNIRANIKLSDGPDGFDYIGHNVTDTGKYHATVLTFASKVSVYDVVQLCFQRDPKRIADIQPRIAYRYGSVGSGSTVTWSAWSVLSQDAVLHSSNRVVDIDTYSTITFGDFNDAPVNAIFQVDLNTGTTVLNNPSPGHSGLLMTFAFSPMSRHALIQHHYAIEDSNITMYIRYSYKNGPNDFRWTAWKKVCFDDGGTQITNHGKLASGTDLNTIFDNAIYLLGDQSENNYTHSPWVSGSGFLTVKQTGVIGLQIAEKISGDRLSRYTADSGSTWSEWV